VNYYYHPNPESENYLSPEESLHAIKVMRSKTGDRLSLVDGKGNMFEVEIENLKKCRFLIKKRNSFPKKPFAVHIAIAPTKNIDRLEWFVEKACELGVDKISIIHTSRTIRKKVNHERLIKKSISAMKQSGNFWLCQIDELQSFSTFLKNANQGEHNFIAYVETGKENLLQSKIELGAKMLIVIGPEGDFTLEEFEKAQNSGFQPVSLGQHVLRTETAGVVAVHTVNLMNQQ